MAQAAQSAKNEQNGSREGEQVCETAEEYLEWYMNHRKFEISEKREKLDDSIDKDCS